MTVGMEPSGSVPDVVEVDGLVVLKIIQHVRQSTPVLATGQLLGLEKDKKLLVTHSFPIPTRAESDMQQSEEKYQIDMMQCLRDVHVDHNTVGWYQSCYLGSFINQALVETQFNYQQTIPEAVVLVYDPERTVAGSLSLRAFRLTESFMNAYKDKKFGSEEIAEQKITATGILEEVPLVIGNSSLAKAYLASVPELNQPNLEFIGEPVNEYLEKSMELLLEFLEEKQLEDAKFEGYGGLFRAHHGRRGEDEGSKASAAGEVSRLDSLMVNAQLHEWCRNAEQMLEMASLKVRPQ